MGRLKRRDAARSKRPIRRAAQWVAEALESRLLLSAVAWTGAGDGANWTDPDNWDTHALPGPSDDVTINVAGNPTIQVASGTESVKSLTSGDDLAITGGTLLLASSSRMASLTLASGELGGSGDLMITGSLTWTGGTMDGSGKTTLAAGASGSFTYAPLAREFDNAGAVTLITPGSLGGVNNVNTVPAGWVFNNLAGATFTMGDGTDLLANNRGLAGVTPQPGAFNNSGTLNVAGAGRTVVADTDVSLNNTGTVDVASGTLELDGGGLLLNQPGVLRSQPGTAVVDADGNVLGDTKDADRFAPLGTLSFSGGSSASPDLLEAMANDVGFSGTGFTRNFAYGTLALTGNAYVKLVDQNRNSSGTGPEAVYVQSLVVPAGTTLDLGGLNLYARAIEIAGIVLNGSVTTGPSGGPLAFGVSTSGQITPAGHVDDWTFFGRAGNGVTVVVDPGSGSSATSPLPPPLDFAQVELLDANGNVLASANNMSGGAGTVVSLPGVTLPADGTYHIRVSAPDADAQNTGQYTIGLYDSTVTERQLDLNEVAAGTLATGYDADRWTFSADAGQGVQFHLLNETSSAIVYMLTAPDGSTLLDAVNSDAPMVTLPADGTYTLGAHSIGSAGGSYAFRLFNSTTRDLTPGTPFNGTLAGSAQALLFRLPLTAANPLSITLHGSDPSDHVELYASFSAPPTRQTYDAGTNAAGSSHSLLIPQANAGTWYILVYGDSVTNPPSNFTLQATSGEVVLTGATPSQGAANATTTMVISGAGFNSGSTLSLVAADGTAHAATNATVDLPTQITATFAANSVPAGDYSVRVTQTDGAMDQLPNVLHMTSAGQGVLTTHLELPDPMTRQIAQTLYIDYTNTGNAPMPAPLLVLSATNPSGQQGALFTLNPALQGEGLYTNNTPVGYSQMIEVLASGATPGVLQPGESERVPVYYAGWLISQWDFSQSTLNFSLDAIQADDSRPMNWTGATYVSGTEDFAISPEGLAGPVYSFPFSAVIPWTNGAPPSFSQANQDLDSGTIPLEYPPNGDPTFFKNLYENLGAFDHLTLDNQPGIIQSPPPSIPAGAWNVIASSLQASDGSSLGNYVQSLDNEAAYLGRLGEDVTDIQSLWGFEVQQANNSLNPLAPYLTSVTDDSLSTPGSLSLSFGRVYSESISGRDTMSPLGMGWATSWQTSATANADGSVTISSPGGGQLTFEPDSRSQGAYFSPLGDTSTLAANGSGGYLLTAADGIQTDYTSAGLLNFVQDTNGNRITAAYSDGRLSSLTASSGQFIDFAYNSAGLISSVTDSAGRATTYVYDPSNTYLVSVIAYTGQATDYGYNSAGGSASRNALTVIAFPGGTHQYFTYDTVGRLSGTSGDNNSAPQTFAYNLGQVSITDGTGNTSNVYYNENDQVAKSVDALGNPTYYNYDAHFNLTKITNASGQSESYAYNGVGEVTASTDFLGNTTHFAYGGPFNELTSLTDANGNVTQYAYDSSGNLLSTTYADGSRSSSTFNPLGEATSFLNQNGQPISYAYNAAGQVTQESFSDGTSYTYTYDANGNLLTATDPTGTTTFTYDPNTRYLTEVQYPGGLYLKFSYNGAGQRTQMVDQTGFTTDYVYDAAGRLSQLTDGSGNVIVTYTYDAAGRLSKKVNGNGTYTTYMYDPDGNVLDLVNYAPGGTINSSFAYTYNALGLETTETTIDGTWAYTYDADGQLTHAVFTPNATNPDRLTPQDLTYNYDRMGNRTSTVINGVTTAYSVNSMNEYTSVGGVAYIYDPDGNLLSDGTNALSYNALNQITAITAPGLNTRFTVNSLGQQIASTLNGTSSRSLIDPTGLGDVVEEIGQSGMVAYFRYGLGLTSAVSGNSGDTNTLYYDCNLVGSIVGISGTTGRYLNIYPELPFGDGSTATSGVATAFDFLGEYGSRNLGNGLYLTDLRDYSSTSGRFTSRDPADVLGGFDLYTYSSNDPINLVDPAGLGPIASMIGATANYLIDQGLLEKNYSWETKVPMKLAPSAGGSGNAAVDWAVGRVVQPVSGYLPTAGPVLTYALNAQNAVDLVNGIQGINRLHHGGVLNRGEQQQLDQLEEPPVPPGSNGEETTNTVNAQDPNALYGPSGYGDANTVRNDVSPFAYRVTLENAISATAPAQEVTISDQLAPGLDWNTFQLTSITFGGTYLTAPVGSQHFETTVPMTYDGQKFDVQIEAGIHLATGEVYAIFQSIDPATGLPPSNPLVGFLPPEDGSGRGDGSISFSVSPVRGLPTGTQIRNVADITFDQGLTISTDQVNDEDPTQGVDPDKQALVTIDAGPPTSRVSPLAATESSASFPVSWSGQDDAGGSGIASYDIYVSIDGGPFLLWLGATTQTTGTFTGQTGHRYAFYSQAADNVGNQEPPHASADTQTQIVASSGSGPMVTAEAFHYDRNPPTLSFQFNEALAAGLTTAAIQIVSLSTGATVAVTAASFDPATDTATFTLPAGLADGNYQARLISSAITDASGNHLDGLGKGTAADFSFGFFVLAGDVNRDRTVSFSDLLLLAQTYGQAGAYSQGDLNLDGKVGFSDLLILAQNYGHALPPAPSADAVEVDGAAYAGDLGQHLSFTFSSDVSASLSTSAVQVKNLSTAATFSPAGLQYDKATNTATFAFRGALPNGRYQVTLLASAVADAAGHRLDGAGDGIPGSDYTFQFSAVTGDLNADGQVGFADLLMLAQNYGKAGTFVDGDLNSDGTVDFADLLMLAQNYGKAV